MDQQTPAQSLTDAFSLADAFGDCVEAINLIHGINEDNHSEEILISKFGIEQARLLIWADVVGICSPPVSTGITHAVPKKPGALNPEPDKAMYFNNRDIRLDDPRFRQRIEDSLKAIANPMTHMLKNKMLETYGLDLFKGSPQARENHMLAPNQFRLQAFREKYQLLHEVTQAFPHAHAKQRHLVNKKLGWSIQDISKATELATLIRHKIDYLVQLMDAQARLDKAFRNDIRSLGWHPGEDINATMRDTLKLSILVEASETLYPEYCSAAQEAMDNVTDQWKGNHGYSIDDSHHNPIIHKTASHTMLSQPLPPSEPTSRNNSLTSPPKTPTKGIKGKRGGLLGGLRPKLTRLFSGKSMEKLSIAEVDSRAKSESGPSGLEGEALSAQRSRSLANDDLTHVLTHTATLESKISRHDQYRPNEW